MWAAVLQSLMSSLSELNRAGLELMIKNKKGRCLSVHTKINYLYVTLKDVEVKIPDSHMQQISGTPSTTCSPFSFFFCSPPTLEYVALYLLAVHQVIINFV